MRGLLLLLAIAIATANARMSTPQSALSGCQSELRLTQPRGANAPPFSETKLAAHLTPFAIRGGETPKAPDVSTIPKHTYARRVINLAVLAVRVLIGSIIAYILFGVSILLLDVRRVTG